MKWFGDEVWLLPQLSIGGYWSKVTPTRIFHWIPISTVWERILIYVTVFFVIILPFVKIQMNFSSFRPLLLAMKTVIIGNILKRRN